MKWTAVILGLAGACTSFTQAQKALLSVPVNVDGMMKDLTLLDGQTLEMAAASFLEMNGIAKNKDQGEVTNIMRQLTELLNDEARKLSQPKPVLSVPFTLQGQQAVIELFDGQTVDQALFSFFDRNQFTDAVRQELYPQLLELVLQKVNENKEVPQKMQPMFTLPLVIDGQEVLIDHFDGQSPVDEARNLLMSRGVTDQATLNNLVPQVANMIQERLTAIQREQVSSRREILSYPLDIDGKRAVLVHYEGFTPTQSANYFLQSNGITDASIVQSYIPQLVELIENNLAKPVERTPYLTIPLTVGQQSADLVYYEGDDMEATATQFLISNGLQNNPGALEYLQQLTSLLRERVEAKRMEMNRQSTLLFSLPVSLGTETSEISFYEGNEPEVVAKEFCLNKQDVLRASLDEGIDLETQLTSCTQTMMDHLQTALTRMSDARKMADRKLLFTLNLQIGEDRSEEIQFYEGEDAEEVAKAFVSQHGLAVDYIPSVADVIRNEIAQM